MFLLGRCGLGAFGLCGIMSGLGPTLLYLILEVLRRIATTHYDFGIASPATA